MFKVGSKVCFSDTANLTKVDPLFVPDWKLAQSLKTILTVEPFPEGRVVAGMIYCSGFQGEEDAWWVREEHIKLVDTTTGMSMVEGVAFTNDTFGKGKIDSLDPEFWAKLEAQAKLVISEATELLEDGVLARNMKEVRDGTSDVLVTALGFPHLVGFDVEEDMKAVLASNLSKVCKTMDDAWSTHAKYLALGVETYIDPCPTMPGFIVKSQFDQVGSDGKDYPKGKFLKCVVSFKEPVFS